MVNKRGRGNLNNIHNGYLRHGFSLTTIYNKSLLANRVVYIFIHENSTLTYVTDKLKNFMKQVHKMQRRCVKKNAVRAS